MKLNSKHNRAVLHVFLPRQRVDDYFIFVAVFPYEPGAGFRWNATTMTSNTCKDN